MKELVEVSTCNGKMMIMIYRDTSGYFVELRNYDVIKGHMMPVANFEVANSIINKHLDIIDKLSTADRNEELSEYLNGFPMNLVESLT